MEKQKRKNRNLFSNTMVLVLPSILWVFIFLILPMCFIVAVSFWQFTGYSTVPAFTFENYSFLSWVDLKVMLKTLEYSVIIIFLSFIVAFPAVYFLTFKIKTQRSKIALFIFCMIPFWTSYLTRTVAWFPMLARKSGMINLFLISVGIIDEPIEWLIFSEFGTILVMLQLYVLMMLGPIFFSLSKIDKSLIDAAGDLGAPFWRIFKEILLPLSMPGIAIGSIFVFVLTMGDFSTPAFIGGGMSATVGTTIANDLNNINFAGAAVKAVLLLIVMGLGVGLILRIVDIRKEL
jgi:putative spermidine/putrescine transport system permease protein